MKGDNKQIISKKMSDSDRRARNLQHQVSSHVMGWPKFNHALGISLDPTSSAPTN